MSRFLLTSELGRGYGHSTRLANIADMLVESGHGVVVCSRHARQIKSLCNRHVAFFPLPLPVRHDRAAPTNSYHDIAAAAGLADFPTTKLLVKHWHNVMATARIDFVIAEHAPASILAAQLAQLPTAHVGTGFIIPPLPLQANLAPWLPPAPMSPRPSVNETIRRISRTTGDELKDLEDLLSYPSRHFLTFAELDHFPGRSAKYYGTLEYVNNQGQATRQSSSGSKGLFVYLPITHPIHNAVRELAKKGKWRVIWHDTSIKHSQEVNGVQYSSLPVTTDKTLQADVIMSRGGHGLSAQAMLSAIPHLVLPDRSEPALLSRRIIQQSFGQTLPPDPSLNDLETVLSLCCHDMTMKIALQGVKEKYKDYSADEMKEKFTRAIFQQRES